MVARMYCGSVPGVVTRTHRRTHAQTLRRQRMNNCSHHWCIEEAKGAKSKGVCKLCGDVKEFNNKLSLIPGAKALFIPKDKEAME